MPRTNGSTATVSPVRFPQLLKSSEVTLTIDELACIVYASVRAALDAHEAHEEPSSLWDAVVPAVEQAVGRA